MSLESRVNKLEQKGKPKDQDILVIWPEDDREKKVKQYKAEHGEPPGFIFEVVLDSGKSGHDLVKEGV